MTFLFTISLPFKDPILVFVLVLIIILLAPILLKKIRVPSIIGLIIAGVLVGPNGFNLLMRDTSIVLFGTVGLLYIMFLAGLEMDLNEFKASKNKSLIFGAFTFIIPLGLGFVVTYYILDFSIMASILISSMFSTHTLIAYPIASRLGITRHEVVTVAVGGTIITDTAVLLVLAVVSGSSAGSIDHFFWGRLIASIIIFTFIVLWVFPKIGKWFFKNIEGENVSQYIFVLAMVFIAAFLAELAGVEGIIGAFLAGLALNRLIPHTSALMNRIEFVGNALFIPFFLISVGMLVDLRILLKGPEALIIAGTLTIVALITKWLAASAAQAAFKYSTLEKNLLFGLSSAHAAATLAVILVGYNIGLIDENVLNGTIILILITCMVSSFVTERAGREIALKEISTPSMRDVEERILVPIANPQSIEQLMEFAVLLKDKEIGQTIYPLSVVKDNEDSKRQIFLNNKMLESSVKLAAATDDIARIVSRVDINVASGILRAAKELMISKIIMGWNAKFTTADRIFGTTVDNLLEKSEQMIFVTRFIAPLNTTSRLMVLVPKNAEYEMRFMQWVNIIKNLANRLDAKAAFYSSGSTLQKLKETVNNSKPKIDSNYFINDRLNELASFSDELKEDDLLIIISTRKGSVSYSSYLDDIPKILSKNLNNRNFVIIYPEQIIGHHGNINSVISTF
jgi:Kef-type K+ transport system membrane component KefB